MRLVALSLMSLMVCLACAAAIHFVIPAKAGIQPAHVQATIYSADDCKPCIRYVEAVRKQLPKRGLIVRDADAKDAAAADILITKQPIPGVDSFPTTIIRRDGREIRRIVGEISPLKLAEQLDKQ